MDSLPFWMCWTRPLFNSRASSSYFPPGLFDQGEGSFRCSLLASGEPHPSITQSKNFDLEFTPELLLGGNVETRPDGRRMTTAHDLLGPAPAVSAFTPERWEDDEKDEDLPAKCLLFVYGCSGNEPYMGFQDYLVPLLEKNWVTSIVWQLWVENTCGTQPSKSEVDSSS